MQVGGALQARSVVIVNAARRQRILSGPWDQGHGPHTARNVGHCPGNGTLCAAHDFEGKLWHPVAEGGQVQILEHHIGYAAIGWCQSRPFDGSDFCIGQLALAPRINAHRQSVAHNLIAIGPNPANAQDLSLAKRHRKTDRIGIGLGHNRRFRFRALATPALLLRRRNRFLEPRRPDHLPRHAHPAKNLADGRAFAGSHHPDTLHPPHFNHRGP